MTNHFRIDWQDGTANEIEMSTSQTLDVNAGALNHLALIGDEQITVDDTGTITTHDAALPLDDAA